MPTMPPFVPTTTTKARSRIPEPDDNERLLYERQFADALSRELARRRVALFRDVSEDSAETEINRRLADRDYWQPLTDVIVKWLQTVAAAGVMLGAQQAEAIAGISVKAESTIEFDWSLANNEAAGWAIRHGQTLTGQLAKTTTPRIQAEVANWIQNKESLAALISRVQQDPLLYSYARARRIAVTEVTRAYAHGNREAWAQSKIITQMVWRTSRDEDVCLICRPLEGTVTAVIGGEFEHPGGEGGADRFRGGRWPEPPAHTLCRCGIAPVATEVQIDAGALREELGL